MNHRQLLNCLLTIALLLGALTNVRAQDIKAEDVNQLEANSSGENVILQWNRVLQETIRTPGVQPATIRIQRSFAMMHLAMFDAVNSIEGSHTPYLTEVAGGRKASVSAAAALRRARRFGELVSDAASDFCDGTGKLARRNSANATHSRQTDRANGRAENVGESRQ